MMTIIRNNPTINKKKLFNLHVDYLNPVNGLWYSSDDYDNLTSFTAFKIMDDYINNCKEPTRLTLKGPKGFKWISNTFDCEQEYIDGLNRRDLNFYAWSIMEGVSLTPYEI